MHHPDIHDILITIQDFLLFADDQSRCEIVPESYYFNHAHYSEKQRARGFFILRKLSLGWLKVKVMRLDEDENTVIFEYLSTPEHNNAVKTIEIKSDDYSIDRVKDAIREILIMDKKPKSSSLDSIRNKDIAMQP
jgi:TATA-binding protein-associated factor Taf7